ncbi:ABC transporter permease [Bacillus sp. Y1]|nr:ABC transporter permease [Bacillus sp. Y1]
MEHGSLKQIKGGRFVRKIVTICGLELKRLLKKKQSYVVMFLMPLLFTFIFGGLSSGESMEKTKVLLVDKDDSFLSKEFTHQLKELNSLFIIETVTESKMTDYLESKKVAAALVIPRGFEEEINSKKEPEMTFLTIPEFTSSGPIKEVVENRLMKLRLMVSASSEWSRYSGDDWTVMYEKIDSNIKETSFRIKKMNVEEKRSTGDINGASRVAPGFSIMFVMIMIMSVTGTILEARNSGVWSRLLIAPASRFEIAAGYLLFFFIIGFIQFALLIVSTHYLFGVYWGDPVALLLLMVALLLAVVGIGLLIATLVKTVEQQAAIGNVVVVATCMISGVYWPLEIEPEFMQNIAQFLPQTWAMSGFTDLLVNGAGVFDIIDQIGLLLGFAILFLFIGISRVKFE